MDPREVPLTDSVAAVPPLPVDVVGATDAWTFSPEPGPYVGETDSVARYEPIEDKL